MEASFAPGASDASGASGAGVSPVPASSTMRSSPARTSTQLVLPPTTVVCGPGDAMLPRTPQNRISNLDMWTFLAGELITSRVPGHGALDFRPFPFIRARASRSASKHCSTLERRDAPR